MYKQNHHRIIIFQNGEGSCQWILELTVHDYQNANSSVFPPPHPPLDAKSNIQEWKSVPKQCSYTNKFCWDILLHVNEKSKNKVEKDKKNLSTFNEVLANNISQSTASISISIRGSQLCYPGDRHLSGG